MDKERLRNNKENISQPENKSSQLWKDYFEKIIIYFH